MLSHRALFPERHRSGEVIATGLGGRPLPVEQADPRPRYARTMLSQLAEPFAITSTEIM